ncbi:MAG: hypothetical protein FWE50_01040 [Alphaproteobacteria bacterium]|nr:hypothetical protein [Alphaproteobacteria bacterium]
MNEISPQDKVLATNLLLRLVGEEVLTPMEKRDILHEITHLLTGFNTADIVNDTNNRRRLLLKRINENETYSGLAGEIIMDMDAKTLRIFDGETTEGILLGASASSEIDVQALLANLDYVIDSGTVGNSWYRKYKSGWIEQGGKAIGTSTSSGVTITLPRQMSSTNYTAIFDGKQPSPVSTTQIVAKELLSTRTSNTLNVVTLAASNYIALDIDWVVYGMAAQV